MREAVNTSKVPMNHHLPHVDSSFGNWIKQRRKALGLTQRELSQRVGCSVSLIFKIESDERRPSHQIAALLAEHLKIPTDQHDLFLKVARQEKAIDGLGSLSPTSTPTPGDRIADNQTDSLRQTIQPTFPIPLTSLIGREQELRAILQQLQDPACRLLTLMGPGGVGKTRLAMEVAQGLQETFEFGASFVSLAGTNASEFIVPAIAESLGFAFSGTITLKEQLFNDLKEINILLILDNLEHLLDGIEVLDELLEAAPKVKLLTTSREQLNLRTEWTFEIQGLPVPTASDPKDLETNSAVALFLQRTKQTKVDFRPTTADLGFIKHICQLVEGLPLGLELAATWVNTLSCEEIATEIERGLDFLKTSKRDLPQRHRSIIAVFDYSWKLLSAEEQNVLKKLSVFHGGFQRIAADQVAKAPLSVLSSLVSKSFIRRNDAQTGRFDQHELVRQYAARHLREDLRYETSARDRHSVYYLNLWSESEHQLKSAKQREILRELTTEIDNFRTAWDWAIHQKQFREVGASLRAFLILYDLRGWYPEGIERLEALIQALHSQSEHAEVSGTAIAFQGWFYFRRGQIQAAYDCFEQGLTILRPLKQSVLLADVLSTSAPVLASLGESEKALEYVTEALTEARSGQDRWQIAYALMIQGGVFAGMGRYDEAYVTSQEALAHFRALGDVRLIVVTLNTLGFVSLRLARYDDARVFLQESLSLISPAEDPWSVGTAYGNLGIVELAEGNGQTAKHLLQKSISLFADLGMLGDVALYLTYLGDASALLGGRNEAEEYWRNAIHMAYEARAIPTVLSNLIRLAQSHADGNDFVVAYEWANHVLRHPSAWGDTKSRAQTLCSALEAHLTERQIETLKMQAQSKSLETYITTIPR
jgi:predicted ATPase/transcriptional regulator with XRE-family HTH domain